MRIGVLRGGALALDPARPGTGDSQKPDHDQDRRCDEEELVPSPLMGDDNVAADEGREMVHGSAS